MRVTGVIAVLLLTVPPAIGKDYSERMEFREFRPCNGNGSMCAPQYLAQGVIDKGATARLRALVAANPNHPLTIAFDSPGGDLGAGITLGLAIRELGFDTLVADSYSEESYVDSPAGYDVEMLSMAEDARCASACAYAFMGGVSRAIEGGATIDVHQFYAVDRVPSIEDSGQAQKVVALISQYMASMGVDRQVLDVASVTESSELAAIDLRTAQAFNLDNQSPPPGVWEIKATNGGDLSLVIRQQKPGGDRVTALAIGRSAEWKGKLFVVVQQSLLKTVRDTAMVDLMAGQRTQATLCTSADVCANLTSLMPWTYEAAKDRQRAAFLMDEGEFLRIAFSNKPIRFEAGFPNMFYRVSPSVDLNSSGLRASAVAVLK